MLMANAYLPVVSHVRAGKMIAVGFVCVRLWQLAYTRLELGGGVTFLVVYGSVRLVPANRVV